MVCGFRSSCSGCGVKGQIVLLAVIVHVFRGYSFPTAVTFVYLQNSLWSLLWVGTCDLVKGQTKDWGSSSCNLKLRLCHYDVIMYFCISTITSL